MRVIKDIKDKKDFIFLAMLCLLLPLNFCSYKPFTINTSPSVPKGIYFVVPNWICNEYKREDMVLFKPPKEINDFMVKRGYINKKESLVKQIKGVAKDKYYVDDRFFYVNDEYMGTVFTKDSRGRVIVPKYGSHEIEDGYFLPVGQNTANSYDGRYFGTIPLKNIEHKVIPLITF